MPQEWADDILLSELADEPELSEEFGLIFARLRVDAAVRSESAESEQTQVVDALASASDEDGPRGGEGLRHSGGKAGSPPGVPHIVLNFAGVTRLNSSHIAQLLRMHKLVTAGGRRLVICAMNKELSSIMRLTGLERVFTFVPDTVSGLASVQIEDEAG